MKEETTIALLETKALAGDVEAQFYLSVIFEDGRGVEPDLTKAAEWCSKAAQAGDRQSQYRLSKMLESGRGFERRQESAAWFWLDKAARAGHMQARFELGLRHLFGVYGVGKSLFRAKRWFASAAQNDHPEANYYLGFMYLHGLGFAEDPQSAFQYFRRAAELNSTKAQCSLAYMHEHGIGCTRDLSLSWQLYERSATRGHVGAQLGLACLALSLAQYKDALVWLDIAANNGVVPAQALLAKVHMNGLGTKRDPVQALMWCLVVQNSEDVDQESSEIVSLCHDSIVLYSHQRQMDEAYTLACQWLHRRAQVSHLAETDWNERLKSEIALYEKHKKRWV